LTTKAVQVNALSAGSDIRIATLSPFGNNPTAIRTCGRNEHTHHKPFNPGTRHILPWVFYE